MAQKFHFRWRAEAATKRFWWPFQSRSGPKSHLSGQEVGGRNLLKGERGSELVEFAFCAPILFVFIFGLIQMCLAFYSYDYISELAREGTRWAMVRGSACSACTANASTVEAYVSSIDLPNIGGGTVTPVASYPDGDEVAPHRVKVVITYNFPYNIPFIPNKTLTMTATSEMPIEQ